MIIKIVLIFNFTGKVCARYSPPPAVAQITTKINQKCCEARRVKRVPVQIEHDDEETTS